MDATPLKIGEIGILQNLGRSALNGQIAEVIGGLRRRMLYCLTDPARSEICDAYAVKVPGFPAPRDRIVWCVQPHQIRRIIDPDKGLSAATRRGQIASAPAER
ncbi:MAG: hypothetical protein HYR49_03550 [Gammaproteobacteria bacterium]|nr:hypothetical protein [Gammaproteobacteria bacterium]